jgi:hypothetical protein
MQIHRSANFHPSNQQHEQRKSHKRELDRRGAGSARGKAAERA